MNRTKLLTIAVIGLLLINLGTLGVLSLQKPGQSRQGQVHPPHGEGPRQLIIDRLRFNEEQIKKYDAIITGHRTKTEELREESRELHNGLYGLLKSESIDQRTADTIILKIAENQKAIDNLNFEHFRNIKAICEPTQVSDFNELANDLARLFGPKGPPPPRH